MVNRFQPAQRHIFCQLLSRLNGYVKPSHPKRFFVHLKNGFFFGDVILVALAERNDLAQYLGVVTLYHHHQIVL